MTEEDLDRREGWLEKCAGCNGTGVTRSSLDQIAICPDCEGACFIPHFGEDEECLHD